MIKQVVTSTYNSFGSDGLKVNSYPKEYWNTEPLTLTFQDPDHPENNETFTYNQIKIANEVNKDLSIVGFLTKLQLALDNNFLAEGLGEINAFINFGIVFSTKNPVTGIYTSNIGGCQTIWQVNLTDTISAPATLENALLDDTDILGGFTGRSEKDFSGDIKDVVLLMWYSDGAGVPAESGLVRTITPNCNITLKTTQEA